MHMHRSVALLACAASAALMAAAPARADSLMAREGVLCDSAKGAVDFSNFAVGKTGEEPAALVAAFNKSSQECSLLWGTIPMPRYVSDFTRSDGQMMFVLTVTLGAYTEYMAIMMPAKTSA